MVIGFSFRFHKNMALLREEQLKLAEKAEVQQRSRLVTELNIRESCNRALSGVRHRINEIHVQMKQKEMDHTDEQMVTSTLNTFEGILVMSICNFNPLPPSDAVRQQKKIF